MSRTTSKTLLRLCVGSVAAATVGGALVLPFGSAQAATGDTISIAPSTQTGTQGTCLTYTATYSDASQGGAVAGRLVDVVITPRSSTQTVDFCTVDANGAPQQTGDDVPTTSGIDGERRTQVADSDGDGIVSFGVFAVTPILAGASRTVDITAFLDDATPPANDTTDRNATTGNNTREATEAQATATAVFTEGGADAITTVDATPEVAFDVEGGSTTFTVTATDVNGRTVAGARVRYQITSGPDRGAVMDCTTATRPTTAPVTNNAGVVRCDVTNNNQSGTDVITFFVDQTTGTTAPNGTLNAEDAQDEVQAVFQEPQAAGTTVTLTSDAKRTDTAGSGSTQYQQVLSDGTVVFTARVLNAAGAPVSGAVVQFTAREADGSEIAGDESLEPRSARTDANGFATTTLNNATVLRNEVIRVQAQIITAGSTSVTDQATVTFRDPLPTEARTLTLSTPTPTRVTGDVASFRAVAVDRLGNGVANVRVTFVENGTGRFGNGLSTIEVFTNAAGEAVAELTSAQGETPGSNTVTATITGFRTGNTVTNREAGAGNDECELPANRTVGTTADEQDNEASTNTTATTAGDCDATATVNFTANSASPVSPSPSTTPTASTSPSATPTASGSPSATPTNTPGTPRGPISATVSPTVITPGVQSVVIVRGAPGTVVELVAYSRPNTTFQVVRPGTAIGEDGTVTFRVTPGTNTRLFARVVGTEFVTQQFVINVRTALSLTVVRNGPRNYTFQGRILPRRAGQLITLYRVANGREILTSQIKTDSSGTYFIPRRFTGSGTFGFLTRTGQTLTNAAGVSNNGQARPTAIF